MKKLKRNDYDLFLDIIDSSFLILKIYLDSMKKGKFKKRVIRRFFQVYNISFRIFTRPVALHPHLTGGLALSQIGNDFVRLPSGISLREATFKVLETGPLHNCL